MRANVSCFTTLTLFFNNQAQKSSNFCSIDLIYKARKFKVLLLAIQVYSLGFRLLHLRIRLLLYGLYPVIMGSRRSEPTILEVSKCQLLVSSAALVQVVST